MDEANYPEGLKCYLAINAPKLVTVLYKMVSPWVDPRTLQKVRIMGSDYQEELLKLIDPDQLPEEYGKHLYVYY